MTVRVVTHATSTTPIPGDLRAMKRYNISDVDVDEVGAASAIDVEVPLLLWMSSCFSGFLRVSFFSAEASPKGPLLLRSQRDYPNVKNCFI